MKRKPVPGRDRVREKVVGRGAAGLQPGKVVASARKKILLVDDHPMLLVGLKTLINAEPDLVVCAQASDSETALKEIPDCRPDLVITDMTMPGRGGLELIKD